MHLNKNSFLSHDPSSVFASPCTILSRDWTNEGMEGWREGGRAEWVCRDACLHLSAPLKKGCSGGAKSWRVSGGVFMSVERGEVREE